MKIPYLFDKLIPVGALCVLLAGAPVAQAEVSNGPSMPGANMREPAIVTDGPLMQWGLTQAEFISKSAWDAQPVNSTTTYDFANAVNSGQGIYRTGGASWFKIPIHLKSGSRIEAVEFNYCDTGAGDFSAFLYVQPKNAAVSFSSLVASSGTSGCVVETATLASPITVDNNTNSYNIELAMDAADQTILFGSLRVAFTRQISPAPATATFNDVPTSHSFHQAVEALADSGITGGCGGGEFCVNDPVTRGQMAVFLARALGLHWSP